MDAILASPTATSATDVDAERPWPGLAAFTEKGHDFFFGRFETIDELFRRVRRKRLTVLYGTSGLGKTSLLQAGLSPRLRESRYLPVLVRLDLTEGARELTEQLQGLIATAAADAGVSCPAGAPSGMTLWEELHCPAWQRMDAEGRHVPVVLIIDQFEEVFTLGNRSLESEARCERFFAALADLVENRVPQSLERSLSKEPHRAECIDFELDDYRILISIREDYLARLENLRSTMPLVGENRMALLSLNGEDAMEILLEPVPGLVSHEIAERIVRIVARAGWRSGCELPGHPEAPLRQLGISPPILSLMARQLNERRIANHVGEITAPLVKDNADMILSSFYEDCVKDYPKGLREFVEDDLITESGIRESMTLEKAEERLSDRGVPPSVLTELVDRRLLQIEQRLETQRIELTHDVLAGPIRQSRDNRRRNEKVEEAQRGEEEAREREAKVRAKLKRTRLMFASFVIVGLIVVGAISFLAIRYRDMAKQYRIESEAGEGMVSEILDVADFRADETGSPDPSVIAAGILSAGENFLTHRSDPDAPRTLVQLADTLLSEARIAGQRHKSNDARHFLDRAKTTAPATIPGGDDKTKLQLVAVRAKLASAYENRKDFDIAREQIGIAKSLADKANPDSADRKRYLIYLKIHISRIDADIAQADSAGTSGTAYAQKAYSDMTKYAEQYMKYAVTSSAAKLYALALTSQAELGGVIRDKDESATTLESRLDLLGSLLNEKSSESAMRAVAIAYEALGRSASSQQDYESADSAFQALLDIRQQLAHEGMKREPMWGDKKNAGARIDLADTYKELADNAMNLRDPDLAEIYFNDDLQEALAARDPAEPSPRLSERIYDAYLGLGRVQLARRSSTNAEAYYTHAQGILLGAAAQDPSDANLVEELDMSYKELASLHLELEEPQQALDQASMRVAMNEQVDYVMQDGDSRLRLSRALGALAYTELLNGMPTRAVSHARDALVLQPRAVRIGVTLAHGLLLTGRAPLAMNIYAECKNAESSDDEDDEDTVAARVTSDLRQISEVGMEIPDRDRIEAVLKNVRPVKGVPADCSAAIKKAFDAAHTTWKVSANP